MDPNDKGFKEHMRQMGKVAESRKNMRIDFRPKVVARTMTWELILASISLAAVVSLPLYFIKVKPIF